jgi:hypothetical protein
MNPRVAQEQEQYERFTNLRRLSGSITLGGRGDAIDHGNGMVDVPAAAHDKIESANLKLTYPVTETINLPFSITWANHTDLLRGEREIRGNIGFTYDLSPLFKSAPM